MAADRYVVLGLARPRAEWFRAVGQWAATASIPVEFLKCVSADEVRARLRSGRPHSAVLVDGALSSVDRDLLDLARDAACAVLVVEDGRRNAPWTSLGAAATLPPTLSRAELLDALATHAALVTRASVATIDLRDDPIVPATGRVVAVCGAGGAGSSTVAAALAQGLAATGRHGSVLLADFARHAELAMLHDVGDVVPGVQELVDAHRAGWPSDDDVRRLVFAMPARRYSLLLGLRRGRDWSAIRPRSFEAAVGSLRRAYDVVVCDTDADLEGEAEGGSADVEDRNVLSRTSTGAADLVFAVSRAGIKGTHALVRVVTDLVTSGVPRPRIVPVVNSAPRHPRARAEIAAAFADLVPGVAPPIFLPVRRVDEAWRDGAPLPAPLPATVAGAYVASLARLGPRADLRPEPELVAPGSLGSCAEE